MSTAVTDRVFKKAPKVRKDLLDDLDAPPKEELIPEGNKVRQAGAAFSDGAWIKSLRVRAEKHLYVFAKSILGYDFFREFHKELCAALQERHDDPWRTLCLAPRDSGKSTIVGRATPLHVVIQPKEKNHWFAGQHGLDQRIMLVGETEGLSMRHLGVLQEHADGNQLLRAMWPHCFWEKPPKRDWNQKALIFPYPYNGGVRPWPDPTIWASGVGGATVGTHPSMKLNDDIFTFAAANSPVVAQATIDWQIASRALINHPGCIELNIGTRWHVQDVHQYMIDNEPNLAITQRSVIENGRIIWPENYDPTGDGEKLKRLRREFGIMFPLLYMNSAADPELTDFSLEDLRFYTIKNGMLEFSEDARDLELLRIAESRGPIPNDNAFRGMPFNGETYDVMRKHGGVKGYFRVNIG